jgi:Lrp/AsnC family leucine-responsive transcriptional regulator
MPRGPKGREKSVSMFPLLSPIHSETVRSNPLNYLETESQCMGDDPLDNLDRRILHLLQVDARGATDTNIADETDVTGTTVHNRIKKLEDEGVITGYNPEIDYEKAGYPMRVLFICSTDLSERSKMATEALEVRGVVNVREMLAGKENLHVEVVAESTSDVKHSTEQLDNLGLRIVSSNILAEEHIQPWNHFHQEMPSDHDDDVSEPSDSTE